MCHVLHFKWLKHCSICSQHAISILSHPEIFELKLNLHLLPGCQDCCNLSKHKPILKVSGFHFLFTNCQGLVEDQDKIHMMQKLLVHTTDIALPCWHRLSSHHSLIYFCNFLEDIQFIKLLMRLNCQDW